MLTTTEQETQIFQFIENTLSQFKDIIMYVAL